MIHPKFKYLDQILSRSVILLVLILLFFLIPQNVLTISSQTPMGDQEREINLADFVDESSSYLSLEYSPSGKYLAVGEQREGLAYLSLRNSTDMTIIKEQVEPLGAFDVLSWANDDELLVVKLNKSGIAIIKTDGFEYNKIINTEISLIKNLIVLPNSDLLLVSGGRTNGITQVWNISTKLEIPIRLFNYQSSITHVASDCDLEGLIFGSVEAFGNFTVWFSNNFTKFVSLDLEMDAVRDLSWGKSLNLAVLSSYGGEIKIVNMSSSQFDNWNLREDENLGYRMLKWSNYDNKYLALHFDYHENDKEEIHVIDFNTNEIMYKKVFSQTSVTSMTWHPSMDIIKYSIISSVYTVDLQGSKSSEGNGVVNMPTIEISILLLIVCSRRKIRFQ